MEIKFRDLRPDEIEVRVGNVLKDKTTKEPYAFNLLLYKTSRTDMAILDETFGVFGWKNHFYQVKNTMVCSISIWDNEKHEWINKDNGGDDDTQMEQVKSELSDSIKRSGSTLGIGRKLYSASKIYMVVNIDKDNTTSSYYQVKEIEYDETSITKLVVINKKTKQVVISYGTGKNYSQNAEKPQENANEPIRKEDVDFITNYIGGLGGEQYQNFFTWLEKNYGTRDYRSLNAEKGKMVVNRLQRK